MYKWVVIAAFLGALGSAYIESSALRERRVENRTFGKRVPRSATNDEVITGVKP